METTLSRSKERQRQKGLAGMLSHVYFAWACEQYKHLKMLLQVSENKQPTDILALACVPLQSDKSAEAQAYGS